MGYLCEDDNISLREIWIKNHYVYPTYKIGIELVCIPLWRYCTSYFPYIKKKHMNNKY